MKILTNYKTKIILAWKEKEKNMEESVSETTRSNVDYQFKKN